MGEHVDPLKFSTLSPLFPVNKFHLPICILSCFFYANMNITKNGVLNKVN